MLIWDLLQNYSNELMIEFKYQFRNIAFGDQIFNWKWFVTAFGFALFIYTIRLRSFKRSLKRTMAFLNNKRYQTEFYKDVKFFMFKIFYKPFVIVFLGFNVHQLDRFMHLLMIKQNLQIMPIVYLDPIFGHIFKIIVALFVTDCVYYWVHRFEHNVNTFWAFHKTHHRATVLNPLTRNRIHPISYFFNFAIMGLVSTPILHIIYKFYDVPLNQPAYVYLFTVAIISRSMIHLRHTHIKIHYGPIFSYIFISPVMHQVHHSILERHHNKNYGVLFSFWDLLFGSFYLPKKNEVFKFGVADSRNKILSFSEEFTLPFYDAVKPLIPKSNSEEELSGYKESIGPSRLPIR